MKLHLHLGAHKTATTHFQKVLEVNRHLYRPDISYVSMEEFRRNLKWKSGRVDFEVCGLYLDEIKELNSTVIISEENLIGESTDIYKDLFLYSRLKRRVGSLAKFTQNFDEIEVWFSVRSLDSFLPSIYCEALRHHRFKKFKTVYSQNYSQTWLRVVKSIRQVFPTARINVVRYENYVSVLPSIIMRVFGDNEGWDFLHEERPRSSMNHFACQLMPLISWGLSAKMSSRAVQGVSNLLDGNNMGYKFAPFNQVDIDKFRTIYERDIKAIKQMEQVVVY